MNKCHLTEFSTEEQYQEWSKQPLRDRILDFIDYHAGATFVELHRVFRKEFEGDNEYGLVDQNIVFWIDMNKNFIEIIDKLVVEKKLIMHTHPSIIMCYLLDGCCLTLPIAKRPRHTYKTPHWIPSTFIRRYKQ